MPEPIAEVAAGALPLLAPLAGRRVLLTGHTGFKGAWLALWLQRLGAEVTGIALPPLAGPGIFRAIRLDELIDHRIGDIRSPESFGGALGGLDADLIIHMAAQSLVRPSYAEPVDTYLTNVVGTAIVLDAARRMPSLRAVIVVTSDKCYENREWLWPYRECDALGGSDPYSSSKGCAELVTEAYRRSFFDGPDAPAIATVRAGNVFGGGDWAADRIVPDIVRAAAAGTPVSIRNPRSTRPWQHVLEPLHGYLLLAARLLEEGRAFEGAWNFGPAVEQVVDVETLARHVVEAWGTGAPQLLLGETPPGPHEATQLRLDSSKARAQLGWTPRLSLVGACGMAAEWYRAHQHRSADLRMLSEAQIDRYLGNSPEGAAATPMPRALQCA